DVIDCIHTTAASHNRVFMVEVMGHKAGWLTLNAGMAGGADIILIPEIPYNIDSVVAKIDQRANAGHGFTILAVAEGAMSKKEAAMSKKEYKQHMAELLEKYPSVSYAIADKILKKTGKEVRVTVPGHMQRGGTPCAYDRVLSSRLGATAALMISREEYGSMVAIHNHVITSVPLKEVAGKLKTIDPKSDIITEARLLGISFGDD
ncbi:MAG: 6-phosphofructokinase, partial [Oscillospiraceae bacterium]|nr:6-phosphofructokinase [Oscillospiraceae bacterium]